MQRVNQRRLSFLDSGRSDLYDNPSQRAKRQDRRSIDPKRATKNRQGPDRAREYATQEKFQHLLNKKQPRSHVEIQDGAMADATLKKTTGPQSDTPDWMALRQAQNFPEDIQTTPVLESHGRGTTPENETVFHAQLVSEEQAKPLAQLLRDHNPKQIIYRAA